ncbi:MAG: hydrogenase expression/formation protein [Candidatus Brocadia sp. AMX2]|uniref:Hydrogenase maturation protein n=1 Tax=Candidatus Brocadia sinica JPN1 TaxID=1197129 RepID=A0ABQ0K0W9_9BACT|nr:MULTISPECIES: AIR synthase family protein [Brocadia]KXK32928.1 MAG: hydrogenase expression/formation protein [Candidatus Brocadia sinica]MBC6931709.1 hydrogenase expression/formation protein [Candidatus Brocadia sp.]MBL1169348.1 hydrogenase expression/formation protein [Candidatus Brocadia sp. AMX1]NOG42195.1 hydrogenase expression/formation protein [Planctomycetota bacterium]KAA0242255.1 MAG: hydrogenase expression/formation protein [Candidatus Brocadia sp. AMX2]
MKYYSVGKLDYRLLEKLLNLNPINDPRVVVGPRVGEDAAVIDFGKKYLVAKTDPITFTTYRIGWYAVNVNANDIATMGATPKWFLATVLLPEGKTNAKLATQIFKDIITSTQKLNITLCGGHTEISYNIDRPIVIGHMLGEVKKDKLVVNSNAKPGDDLLLTKGIAIEGTAIIARKKETVIQKEFGDRLLKRAQAFIDRPGLSVVADALVANKTARIHAMHDPTEGGIATGILELAKASGTGVVIDAEKILCYEETKQICRLFDIQPLGLIASGALLIALDPKDTKAVIAILAKNSIPCTRIGKLTQKTEGLMICKNGKLVKMPTFKADEITKVL